MQPNTLMLYRSLFLLFIYLSFANCTSPKPETFIPFFEGYWEIDHVVMADGSKKAYKFNPIIDFFEVKDSIGIRKKLQPKLDGTFISTNDSEHFTFKIENDSLYMYYKTPQASWKEAVLNASKTVLIVKNQTGNIYHYRPYQKIEL